MDRRNRQRAIKASLTYIPLLLMFVASLGCRQQITTNVLTGTYAADYASASEKLILLPDGRFQQEIKIKSGAQLYATNGTWRFSESEKEVWFSESFLLYLDNFGMPRTKPKSGVTILPISALFGKIHIGGDPAQDYVKTSNKWEKSPTDRTPE